MAKSDKHAESSAKQYGGNAEDYLEIHEMMDSSKSAHADNRHRVIFHSAFGAYLIQKMFGMDFACDLLFEMYHWVQSKSGRLARTREECRQDVVRLHGREFDGETKAVRLTTWDCYLDS